MNPNVSALLDVFLLYLYVDFWSSLCAKSFRCTKCTEKSLETQSCTKSVAPRAGQCMECIHGIKFSSLYHAECTMLYCTTPCTHVHYCMHLICIEEVFKLLKAGMNSKVPRPYIYDTSLLNYLWLSSGCDILSMNHCSFYHHNMRHNTRVSYM